MARQKANKDRDWWLITNANEKLNDDDEFRVRSSQLLNLVKNICFVFYTLLEDSESEPEPETDFMLMIPSRYVPPFSLKFYLQQNGDEVKIRTSHVQCHRRIPQQSS